MNFFLDIYRGWTTYEWLLLGSSLLLTFVFTNFITYYLTKNWKFNITISITYLSAILTYISSLIILVLVGTSISHLSLIPTLIVLTVITLNWITFISYYYKYHSVKKFSLLKLIQEYKRDSIRNIIFLSLIILSVTIFIRGEILIILIITFISSILPILLSTLLLDRFSND